MVKECASRTSCDSTHTHSAHTPRTTQGVWRVVVIGTAHTQKETAHMTHAHTQDTHTLTVFTLHSDGTRTTHTYNTQQHTHTHTPPRWCVMLAVWLAHTLAR
jgi:hypothetical protein